MANNDDAKQFVIVAFTVTSPTLIDIPTTTSTHNTRIALMKALEVLDKVPPEDLKEDEQ